MGQVSEHLHAILSPPVGLSPTPNSEFCGSSSTQLLFSKNQASSYWVNHRQNAKTMVRSAKISPPRAGVPKPPTCDTESVGGVIQVRGSLHSRCLVPERRGASEAFCLEATGPDHSVEQTNQSHYLEPFFLPSDSHSRMAVWRPSALPSIRGLFPILFRSLQSMNNMHR